MRQKSSYRTDYLPTGDNTLTITEHETLPNDWESTGYKETWIKLNEKDGVVFAIRSSTEEAYETNI